MQTFRPWRTEATATLSLAWPLILANLTMALIQATDVLLMGRLGARPLAASALGINHPSLLFSSPTNCCVYVAPTPTSVTSTLDPASYSSAARPLLHA